MWLSQWVLELNQVETHGDNPCHLITFPQLLDHRDLPFTEFLQKLLFSSTVNNIPFGFFSWLLSLTGLPWLIGHWQESCFKYRVIISVLSQNDLFRKTREFGFLSVSLFLILQKLAVMFQGTQRIFRCKASYLIGLL